MCPGKAERANSVLNGGVIFQVFVSSSRISAHVGVGTNILPALTNIESPSFLTAKPSPEACQLHKSFVMFPNSIYDLISRHKSPVLSVNSRHSRGDNSSRAAPGLRHRRDKIARPPKARSFHSRRVYPES